MRPQSALIVASSFRAHSTERGLIFTTMPFKSPQCHSKAPVHERGAFAWEGCLKGGMGCVWQEATTAYSCRKRAEGIWRLWGWGRGVVEGFVGVSRQTEKGEKEKNMPEVSHFQGWQCPRKKGHITWMAAARRLSAQACCRQAPHTKNINGLIQSPLGVWDDRDIH